MNDPIVLCLRCTSTAWKPFGYSPKGYARFRCRECGRVRNDATCLRPETFGERVSMPADSSPETAALAMVRAGVFRVDTDGSIWRTARIDKWGRHTPQNPPTRADVLDAGGYRKVYFWIDGKQRCVMAHRLVWAVEHGSADAPCRMYQPPREGHVRVDRSRQPVHRPRVVRVEASKQHRAPRPAMQPKTITRAAAPVLREKSQLSPIERMWPKVRTIAKRLIRQRGYPRHIDLDDLVSAGAIGLMKAAGRFDVSRGVRFETFVGHRVKGAMVDHLRGKDPLSRLQREEARSGAVPFFEVQLEHLPPWVQFAAPTQEIADPFIGKTVDLALSSLPDRERRVVRNYFLEGRLLKDIGRDLGVNESRASQLKNQAIERMRQSVGAEQW